MISRKPLERRSTKNIFAGCKSSLLENSKNNENHKQCDNLQDRNVDKKRPKETNNNSLWSSGTCVIVGDSMVNGIDKKRLSKKHGSVKVFHFSGARIEISITT